ncbi:MAG: flagellar protein FliS [Melioribacteraceae bacterium]|nr:flagellar protein FliS [Melioribacteraceae bacterium]
MNYSTAALRTTESYNNNRANAYLTNEIMNASPQKLIMKIYDFAILQCKNENLEKTNRALTELISALRFDGDEVSEISMGLKKLYEFCQDQMRKKNYDIVLQILTDLRETWNSAIISM